MSQLKQLVIEEDIEGLKAYKNNDINSLDNLGFPILTTAVMTGNIEIVKILLEKGCNPNISDILNDTPLGYTEKEFEFHEIAKLLREYGAKK